MFAGPVPVCTGPMLLPQTRRHQKAGTYCQGANEKNDVSVTHTGLKLCSEENEVTDDLQLFSSCVKENSVHYGSVLQLHTCMKNTIPDRVRAGR